MIKYTITYTIKTELTDDTIKQINHVLNVANKILKLKPKVNYFDLCIVSDCKIKKLNKTYRNKDKVTDVISLAYNEFNNFINLEFNHLGEIYIDIKQAKRQAKQYQHSLIREMCFLVLHGLLHLIGYDHIKHEDEVIMFQLQDTILNEAKIKR